MGRCCCAKAATGRQTGWSPALQRSTTAGCKSPAWGASTFDRAHKQVASAAHAPQNKPQVGLRAALAPSARPGLRSLPCAQPRAAASCTIWDWPPKGLGPPAWAPGVAPCAAPRLLSRWPRADRAIWGGVSSSPLRNPHCSHPTASTTAAAAAPLPPPKRCCRLLPFTVVKSSSLGARGSC